jgi:hypothetical protein
VAALFGARSKHRIDEDFVRLKSLLEHGRTSSKGQEVACNELAMPRLKWLIENNSATPTGWGTAKDPPG